MKLTDFQTKFTWGIGILIILLIWMIFPLIFKQLISVYDLPENLKEFGAFGDIYGSLNTLISSMALCAVAYSTTLQVKELRLARKTYTDQLNESKFSNFTTSFYSLLNHKNLNYKNLSETNKREQIDDAQEIFLKITRKFTHFNKSSWKGYLTELQVKSDFNEFLYETYNSVIHIKLEAHFTIYADLVFLIKNSHLNTEDKTFFFRLITNSMTIQEQVSLIWLSSFNEDLRKELDASGILKIGYSKVFIDFLMVFHNKSLFSNSELLMEWEKLEAQKNSPA